MRATGRGACSCSRRRLEASPASLVDLTRAAETGARPRALGLDVSGANTSPAHRSGASGWHVRDGRERGRIWAFLRVKNPAPWYLRKISSRPHTDQGLRASRSSHRQPTCAGVLHRPRRLAPSWPAFPILSPCGSLSASYPWPGSRSRISSRHQNLVASLRSILRPASMLCACLGAVVAWRLGDRSGWRASGAVGCSGLPPTPLEGLGVVSRSWPSCHRETLGTALDPRAFASWLLALV